MSRPNLTHEDVTIFTPFAGRLKLIPGYLEWLMFLSWPKAHTLLLLLETMPEDDRILGVDMSDYFPDVRVVHRQFGPAGLADRPRNNDTWRQLWPVMAQIYGWMRQNVTTAYVLVVEDDVRPPRDVIPQLLQHMGPNVVSVSAAVPKRDGPGWIAWDAAGDVDHKKDGVQPTVGNGWGCVLLRMAAVKSQPIRADEPFDRAFYNQLQPGQALIDWDCVCEHRSDR